MPSRLSVVLVSLLLATPAVAFWLWMVIVPARVAVLCPEGCECDKGGNNVFCRRTLSNPIPLIHLTDIRVFWLGENNITMLEKDSFASMTLLDVLYIYDCGLRTIQLGAFNGLTKLTELTVRDNEISEIIPGTFKNLNNLEFLHLYHNGIKQLDSDVFSGLVNLKVIDLALNEIERLDNAVFSGLVNLESIYLGSNYITHLESTLFSGLVNLESLDLGVNQIQYLHSGMFLGLPNLQYLNLNKNPGFQIPTDRNFISSHSLSHLAISACDISSLSVETFANVSSLKSLDLSFNNLRTLDINILKALPELSTLYLYGNPLQCDCQLQEVWRLCEDRNIPTGISILVPKCDTPSEVKGIWWGVLENGQCLEGNIQYHGDYKNRNFRYSFPTRDPDTERSLNTNLQGFISRFLKQYQIPLYAFPFIFGTTGNVILLIIIICNKDMRTVPNMFILNLAISDITYLTIIFVEACGNRIPSALLEGDNLCIFLAFCRRLSVGLSAYSVAVYSIERYIVTVDPCCVWISPRAACRVTVATICGVWIVAALFAVPSAISNYLCQDRMLSVNITYYQRVVVFELLVSCVLPLCVIAFTFIMTARHLVINSRSVSEGTQNPQLEIRRNTAKIVVGLAVVFVISYVPYHVFWSYFICTIRDTIWSQKNVNNSLHSVYKFQYSYVLSTCFLLINSCLNPVALFWTGSAFRQHLKRYLTCLYTTNTLHNELELN